MINPRITGIGSASTSTLISEFIARTVAQALVTADTQAIAPLPVPLPVTAPVGPYATTTIAAIQVGASN